MSSRINVLATIDFTVGTGCQRSYSRTNAAKTLPKDLTAVRLSPPTGLPPFITAHRQAAVAT